MKNLKFVMYLFYKYYNQGGTKRIPYFSALCAVVFLIYIHLFQLLILLDKVNLLPLNKDDTRIVKYVKIALVFLPIFAIVNYLVKPSELKQLNYDNQTIKNGNLKLVLYIVLNVILLFALMFIKAK